MSTMNADAAATLTRLFSINYDVLKKNLDGVTHEESLIQPTGGGNCLNWVLGHLVTTRDLALGMLKQEPVWSADVSATYNRGSAPIRDGANAQPLPGIVEALGKSQERLIAGLGQISNDDLAAPSPEKSLGDTVGDLLFVLQYHDAYHAGQTGLLRRMAGHDGAIK